MRGVFVAFVLFGATANATPGNWGPAGTSLQTGRAIFTSELRAITLADGRVMVAGGLAHNAMGNNFAAPLVDLFSAGSFAPATSLMSGRDMCGTIALLDGGALVAGGGLSSSQAPLQTAERWNANGGGWTSNLMMKAARFAPTATRLSDGRVLIAGGQNLSSGIASLEIFDPKNNGFTMQTGILSGPGLGHVAALLPDGRVYFCGGGLLPPATPTGYKSADLFDPATGMVTPAPNMHFIRAAHAGARLVDGRILFCGGCTNVCSGPSLASCEIYTPSAGMPGADQLTGSLNVASGAQSMVTLPNGKVLLVGGISNGTPLARAEIFDPATGKWTTTTNSLTDARNDATIALLPDGRVLVAGGRQGVSGTAPLLASAEIFDPGTPTMCTVQQLDGTINTLMDGVPCDDGNWLTLGDQCKAGVCVGTPVDGGLVDLAPAPDLTTEADLQSPADLGQAPADSAVAAAADLAASANGGNGRAPGCGCQIGASATLRAGSRASRDVAFALFLLILLARSCHRRRSHARPIGGKRGWLFAGDDRPKLAFARRRSLSQPMVAVPPSAPLGGGGGLPGGGVVGGGGGLPGGGVVGGGGGLPGGGGAGGVIVAQHEPM